MVYRLRCVAIKSPPPVKGMHPQGVQAPAECAVLSDGSDESDKSDGSDALHKRTGLDSTPASKGCPLHRHRSRHEVPTADV